MRKFVSAYWYEIMIFILVIIILIFVPGLKLIDRIYKHPWYTCILIIYTFWLGWKMRRDNLNNNKNGN